jgi:hypothetical protein
MQSISDYNEDAVIPKSLSIKPGERFVTLYSLENGGRRFLDGSFAMRFVFDADGIDIYRFDNYLPEVRLDEGSLYPYHLRFWLKPNKGMIISRICSTYVNMGYTH